LLLACKIVPVVAVQSEDDVVVEGLRKLEECCAACLGRTTSLMVLLNAIVNWFKMMWECNSGAVIKAI
jgi:hypothetical protein